MRPTNKGITLLIIPPLWLMSTLMPGAAQPATERPLGDPIALPEVIVEEQRERGYLPTQTTSGSRLDLPPRDQVNVIDVVPRALLDDRGVVNLLDGIDTIPGVRPVSPAYTTGSVGIRSRGFENSDTLINGIRFGAFGHPFDSASIERLEVFKGPAGIQYGISSPGGTLNLVTKQPVREFVAQGRITLGSFDFYRGEIDIGGAIPGTNNNLWSRLNVAYESSHVHRDQQADMIHCMEQILTLVCKLQPTPEEAAHIDATMGAFADACAYIHASIAERITNVMRMQAMLYYDVRSRFGLSSNLAQQAFRRVSATRKTAKVTKDVVKAFAPTSIQYDQRIFSFIARDWSVSLTLLHGRVHFRLHLGNYQRGKLTGHTPTSAQLCKHPDGSYAIHIQVKEPVPPPRTPTDVIGVDLGRTDIAHTSTGDTWEGTVLRQVRDHFARMRAVLQRKASKGTRSTRRRCRQLLARLSGRERRFQRHTNHVIAKTLVETAHTSQAALALEDLTGIRERVNQQPRGKTERRRGNSWAFFQLRQFVTYKAALTGVVVYLVPAASTSKMCHACLHLGARNRKRFACTHPACGWAGDADFNAAKNIKILGVSLNLPRGPWVHSPWSGKPAGLLETPCL